MTRIIFFHRTPKGLCASVVSFITFYLAPGLSVDTTSLGTSSSGEDQIFNLCCLHGAWKSILHLEKVWYVGLNKCCAFIGI